MSFSRDDVAIAHFPNADGRDSKPRPVVIVQANVYNAKIHNVVVAAITSNLKHAADPASLLIDITTPDGRLSGLAQDSVVSCINIATINESLIAKKIGRLSTLQTQQVDACLKQALDLP